METNEMNLGIGDKESTTISPAMVEILDVRIDEVGEKKNHKVVCSCKHPSKDEPINISGSKYPNKDKLVVSGLWLNKDEDGKVRKGSALAVLMNHLRSSTIADMRGRNCDTITDENGYLVFKSY